VQELRIVLRQYHPSVCIIEGLFFSLRTCKPHSSWERLAGAAIAAVAEAGLDIFEMAPRKVKQAIVGYGRGAKNSRSPKMVQRMLRLAEVPEPDAADALALAPDTCPGKWALQPQRPEKNMITFLQGKTCGGPADSNCGRG